MSLPDSIADPGMWSGGSWRQSHRGWSGFLSGENRSSVLPPRSPVVQDQRRFVETGHGDVHFAVTVEIAESRRPMQGLARERLRIEYTIAPNQKHNIRLARLSAADALSVIVYCFRFAEKRSFCPSLLKSKIPALHPVHGRLDEAMWLTRSRRQTGRRYWRNSRNRSLVNTVTKRSSRRLLS